MNRVQNQTIAKVTVFYIKGVLEKDKMEKAKGGWGWGAGWGSSSSSKETSNDGSDQRTTCRTLEVISCFIEDFYGILAAHPTSRGEGGENSLSLSHLLSHPFSTMSNPSSWAVWIRVKQGTSTSNYVQQHRQRPAYSAVAAKDDQKNHFLTWSHKSTLQATSTVGQLRAFA